MTVPGLIPLRNQVENEDDIGTASKTHTLYGGDLEVEMENVMRLLCGPAAWPCANRIWRWEPDILASRKPVTSSSTAFFCGIMLGEIKNRILLGFSLVKDTV